MLTRLSVEGFKGLRKVSISLTPLTVLVGPNGVGKSTALEALEVLGRWAAFMPDKKLNPLTWAKRLHTHKDLNHLFSRPNGRSFVLRVDGDQMTPLWGVEVGADLEYSTVVSLAGVVSQRDPGGLSGPVGTAQQDPALNHLRYLRYLKLDVRKLRAPSPAANGIVQMDEEGGGLPTRLQYLTGLRDGSIERIEAGLQRLVPEVRRIFTVPQEIEVEAQQTVTINGDALVHRELRKMGGVGLEVEIAGAGRIPAAQLSEGTLLALGLLTALEEPGVNLLLMDDAERGLHPGAQQKLIAMLRELQVERPELQLILSTHSPDLVDACAPEEVQVFGRNAQGEVEVHPLTEHAKAGEWLGVLRVGEFWSSVGEDWIREQGAAEEGEDAVVDR